MNARTARTGRTGSDSIVLRPSRGEWLVTLIASLLFAGVTLGTFLLGLEWWYRAPAIGFCGLAVAAQADLALRRVTLAADGLHMVKNFHLRSVPREQIQSVTWAKGAGVSLRLADGRWLALPSVGGSPQGATNTIRAWLRRTAAELG